MIVTAYRRILTFSDLWDLRYKDRSCALLPEFEKQWKKETQKASTDLLVSIHATNIIFQVANHNRLTAMPFIIHLVNFIPICLSDPQMEI